MSLIPKLLNPDSYREKQSGQRWSIEGAQNVIDLRLLNVNQQWDVIIDLIKETERGKFLNVA